jgi:hypothetical protein
LSFVFGILDTLPFEVFPGGRAVQLEEVPKLSVDIVQSFLQRCDRGR